MDDGKTTMLGKKIILLVDDNEADNVYHEIILRRSDRVADVVTKDSAAAALEYLSQLGKWPNIILVDVNMPGMDGFALIQEIERLSPPATCKIAMLTSSDAERDRRRAVELPLVSAYLIKPLTLAAIDDMLVE
jgi:CheY-like chemotaxis protein